MILAQSNSSEPDAIINEEDAFYYNLTSGTTGLPKSYALTHYNNSTLGPMFEAFDLTRQDVLMTVFPMFGRVGFAWALAGPMFGARNVLLNFDCGDVLRLVQTERVSIINLVPTMGALLAADSRLAQHNLRSLRAFVFVGAMLPADLRMQVAERVCPHIFEYYGMQETGTLTVSTPEDRHTHPGSVGVPICFAEVRISKADGGTAAIGEIGEILGRSPNAATSYFENPEKSADTFRAGWVHTGDLGSLDEDGYLYIRGRIKDMIVTGGQNVHASEVEDVLMQFPGVTECAVVGLPDEVWGERVTGVIVKASGRAFSPDAARAHCRKSLANFKTPRQFIVRSEPLPRTPTGKVQKYLLVDKYRNFAPSDDQS